MRRIAVGLALVVAALLVTLGVHASASQLLVSSRSMTPTMVASLVDPTIIALQNAGNGVAGRADTGDRVVITFSRPLDASSVCSTWSATAGYTQSISANNAIVVTVNDGGAGSDVLTVTTTSTCGGSINVGTIDLGSPGFTTGGPLTFAGNGNGGRSTIAYDPASAQLVVTFGNRGGAGTAGTVGSVTATFTPAAGLKHSDGSSVLPSTGTVTGVAL